MIVARIGGVHAHEVIVWNEYLVLSSVLLRMVVMFVFQMSKPTN
jgi:hypothetical protein